MNEENNQDTSIVGDNKNIIDALHKSNSLPSLRTYQGDVAEFIKEKNQSVISIAVKEKEKQREEQREESISENKKGDGFKINFVTVILSLFLLLAGSFTVFFVLKFLQQEDPVIVLKQEIIPYNSELSLANITKDSFSNELKGVSPGSGITAIRISDTNGKSINTAPLLLSFLGANPPDTLVRSLKPEFFIGAINSAENTNYLLIIVVDDFGRAFSGMLDWEKSTMEKDLSFLNKQSSEIQVDLDEPVIASPIWKDVIIKNKDTRALMLGGEAIIAYTFLDKNTILLTSSLDSIGEISSTFASRSVIR